MRILHANFSFTCGGAETMLVDIMNRQVRGGDEVVLLVIKDLIDESLLATIDSRVRIVKLNRATGANKIITILKLNRAVRRLHPDIIHIHNPDIVAILRGLDRKIVYTVHDLSLSQKYLRKGIRQVAISEAVKNDVLKLNSAASPVSVIPNGIDVDSIVVRPVGKPIDENNVRILNVGRLEAEKKGQDLLIRALGELNRRGYSGISIDFIGEGSDLESLRQLAENEGVVSQVRFLGKKSRHEVYESYARYDIMVHPARYEGFGLIIAEAMAGGVPVVVPEGGGPWEVIEGGAYGTVYTPNTPEKIAQAIIEVVDKYPLALQVAHQAKLKAAESYSIRATVDAYNRVYRSIITSRR